MLGDKLSKGQSFGTGCENKQLPVLVSSSIQPHWVTSVLAEGSPYKHRIPQTLLNYSREESLHVINSFNFVLTKMSKLDRVYEQYT